MRIGVISDMHGNCVALDAVLHDTKTHAVDRWVCLGDALQGGLQPREVADRLRELDCPVVMGNADAFVLEPDDQAFRNPGQLAIRDWTADQLGDDGLAFIRTFVQSVEIDLSEAGSLLCFHGSPDSYDTILLPGTAPHTLRAELGGRARTMCGGHTHQQWSVSLDGWTFFNPGSAGLAYNAHVSQDGSQFFTDAEYAVLHVDDDRVGVEFLRVPFDPAEIDRFARTSSHPGAEEFAARFRPRA